MNDSKFYLALVIAGILDLVDYGLVGLIPVAGDVLDIIGIVLLYPLIGKYALIGAVEFVPIVGDLLPTFIASVIMAKAKILKLEGEK